MHYLTALLASLLSMLGYQEPAGSTSITRITAPGSESIFSRTDIAGGHATFRCLQSGSGRCFYLVFSERCTGAMAMAGSDVQCHRQEVERFSLTVGQRRELQGLPQDFAHCVTAGSTKECRRD